MKRYKLMASVAVAGMATAAVFAVAGPAQASSDYSHAALQVTFSLNCNGSAANPAPCSQVFGLGGIWGWIAVLPDGTTNAQVTDCGHTGPGGGPGSAGAGHTGFDGTWTEISSPVPPTPITPLDPNGNYLVWTDPTAAGLGLPPMPATPGHYSISFLGAKGQETIAP
jgi:hypothetical protein